jgi:RecB family exonuclease
VNIVTVRASALSDFLDCPARAEAKHIMGLRMPSSGKAVLGTAVHKSTALFDGSTLEGKGLTVEDTAGAAVDAIRRPQEDVVWDEDNNADDAEKIALSLHRKYCKEIAPRQDYAAVEVKCERLEITDIGLALEGTTDRIRRTQDGYGITDIKTGKSAVAADGRVKVAGHTYQLGVYELLAERASGLPITAPAQIAGLNTAKTEKAQRVGTGEVEGARDVLVGDQDSPGILEAVARMIHSGNFFGNPRSMMCHESYCPIHNRCKYRK